MAEAEDFMTVQQAAAHLAVSRPTIYKAIEDGRLASQTVMGRVAVLRADVDALGESLRPQEWREKQREGQKKQGE